MFNIYNCTIALLCLAFCSSCRTYSATQKEMIDNEYCYYEFKERDTILDFSADRSFALPVIATTVNHLHFYLGKYVGIRRRSTLQNLRNFQKQYKTKNEFTYSDFKQTSDSLYLPDNSVDKIVCRYTLYTFKNLDKMISEFERVLKPNGDLIIMQEYVPNEELKEDDLVFLKSNPAPNEQSLIPYFEGKGFLFIESRKIIWNKRMGKLTYERQRLFRFRKK